MGPKGERFRHDALRYRDAADFARRAARFVRAGLAAGEPVLVALPETRERLLRRELAADGAGVEFLPPAESAGNPARLIPVWQDWAERHGGGGDGRLRVLSELARAGGSAAERAACLAHEHVLNAAFAADRAWMLLCAYDAGRLPEPVLAEARRAHGPGDPPGALIAFEAPLPELGPAIFELCFSVQDLSRLRAELRARADVLGLTDTARLSDFVLVADELACNSVIHGGGDGRLLVWAQGTHAVCEVRDKGLISDPLVGRRRPDLRGPGPGAGLWSANQLCDLLLIRSVPAEGTSVRAYLATGAG